MKINNALIAKGFILAGVMNASTLVFSKFFTNPPIAEFDPVVMSNFGLLMILVWGFAYISVANCFESVKWLVGVFAVEKLIYALVWTNWHINNDIALVFETDLFAGVFYAIYGLNDWLFFAFFSFVFFRLAGAKKV
jgi:hypothetical protein